MACLRSVLPSWGSDILNNPLISNLHLPSHNLYFEKIPLGSKMLLLVSPAVLILRDGFGHDLQGPGDPMLGVWEIKLQGCGRGASPRVGLSVRHGTTLLLCTNYKSLQTSMRLCRSGAELNTNCVSEFLFPFRNNLQSYQSFKKHLSQIWVNYLQTAELFSPAQQQLE